MNGALAAGQFNNVQVDSDPGARGMMGVNTYTPGPMSLSGDSNDSYNQEMAENFRHAKGIGQKVRAFSAKTMRSTTWTRG